MIACPAAFLASLLPYVDQAYVFVIAMCFGINALFVSRHLGWISSSVANLPCCGRSPPVAVIVISAVCFHAINCCFSWCCSVTWFLRLAVTGHVTPSSAIPPFLWPNMHSMFRSWVSDNTEIPFDDCQSSYDGSLYVLGATLIPSIHGLRALSCEHV